MIKVSRSSYAYSVCVLDSFQIQHIFSILLVLHGFFVKSYNSICAFFFFFFKLDIFLIQSLAICSATENDFLKYSVFLNFRLKE